MEIGVLVKNISLSLSLSVLAATKEAPEF